MTRHLEIAFIAFAILATASAWYFYHNALLALFVISCTADLHAATMIQLRARKVLDSWEWQVMFLAMGTSLLLTITAVGIIVFPQFSGRIFTFGWICLFALKRVLFAIGFRRHVNNITEEFQLADYAIESEAKAAYTALELAAKVKGALPMTEKEEDDRNDKDQEEQPESEKPTAQPAGDPAPPPPGEVPGPGK
jgi:hypothetical protein